PPLVSASPVAPSPTPSAPAPVVAAPPPRQVLPTTADEPAGDLPVGLALVAAALVVMSASGTAYARRDAR
ncbi:MAG: hypothetical protein JWN08_2725, partial [Frankiales bacterium]|nr:hypothetical protein [Frankiales bacterium]